MPELAVPVDGDPDWTLRLAGALFGDDQPLCCPTDLASDLISDLPDLELPELDLNELDADGFFGELKWYGEQATGLPERGGDDMEDSLLAVLAEGLSHIDGLAGLGGSDGAPVAVASDHDAQDGCSATAPGIHHRPVTPEEQASSSTNVLLTTSDQEDEEPSLLKKLLLAPPNSQQSYEHRVGGSVRCRVPPAERARLPLPFKPQALLKDCTSPSCSELLRHLCAADLCASLSNPKAWGGRGRQRRKATCTLASTAPQSKPPTCQQAKPSSLALPLTPESPGDAKSFASTFENKSLERTLSSELCSTAGLTPPTTPPHKQTLDTMVLCRSNPLVNTPCAGHGSEIPDSTAAHGANTAEQTMVSLRCPLAQSELYAQLRKAMGRPMSTTKGGRTGKKPGPRLFGDHDYCQAFNAALCSAAVAPVAVPFTPIVAMGTVGVSQPSQASLETGPTCGTMVDADVQSEWSDVRRCIHRCSSSAHYNLDNDEKVGKERRPKGDPYCLRPSGPGELGVVLKGTGHICSTPTLCSYSSHQQGDVTSDGESRVESAGPGEPSSWPGSACGSARQGTRQYSPQPNPACKVVSSAGRHPRNHRWQHSKFQFRRSACSSRLERCSRSRSRSPLAQVTRCGGHHGISQEISHRQDLEIPMEQISSGLECPGEKEEPCPQAKNCVDLFEGLQAGVLGVQDDREGVGQAEAGANVPHGNGEASVCGTFRHTGVMCAADRNLRKDSEEVDDTGLQCGKDYYTDLDPTVDDFDPLDSKSKYDTMDFDSLLREAQGSLRR